MANFNQSPLGQTTISANLAVLISQGSNADTATITRNPYAYNVDGSGTSLATFTASSTSRPVSGQLWPRYIFSG